MKKYTYIKLGLVFYLIAILGSQFFRYEMALWILVPAFIFYTVGLVIKIKEERQNGTFAIKNYLPAIVGVFTCICIFGYFYFSA